MHVKHSYWLPLLSEQPFTSKLRWPPPCTKHCSFCSFQRQLKKARNKLYTGPERAVRAPKCQQKSRWGFIHTAPLCTTLPKQPKLHSTKPWAAASSESSSLKGGRRARISFCETFGLIPLGFHCLLFCYCAKMKAFSGKKCTVDKCIRKGLGGSLGRWEPQHKTFDLF